MADEVEEKDDDDWSEAMTETPNDGKTSKNNSMLEVSSAKISEPQLPVELEAHILQSIPKDDATLEDKISFQVTDSAGENVDDKKPVTLNLRGQPRSECRARSRNTRQCQKHFQEMIGKHEIRNEELEQQEGNLRERLETLECSMPAVMVWNIWRMAQGAPTSVIRRLMEKQFQDCSAENMAVPTTPSQHWDERVRKIEAERKEALRRAEEARILLAEKEAAIRERRKRLEEAKKCNQERKEKMEKLAREAADLREALKNARGDDNSCETGECGEIRCKEKWLEDVGSVSSIGSADLECFAKLQELAEAEICMKRQISELERREEAYMRTLQQADEMWSKMEGDTADTVSELQDQLDLKTTANQQLADRICQLEDELESLKKRLISSKDALSQFTDKIYTEAKIGLDDSEVTVKDRAVVATVKAATASVTAAPKTFDQESLAYPETMDEESSVVAPEYSDAGLSAFPKTFNKSSEAIPIADQINRGTDPVTGLGIDVVVGDEEPEHLRNWNWDEGCPPDIVCNDLVESSTGTDDVLSKGVPTTDSKVQAGPDMVEQPVGGHGTEDMANFATHVQIHWTDATEQTNDPVTITEVNTIIIEAAETVSESDQIIVSREELRNWYNIVDSVHHVIAKCDNCSSKTDDTAQLAEKIKLHLRIKGLAGVKGPMIMEKILGEPLIASKDDKPISLTSSTGEMQQKIKPVVLIDPDDLPDESESYIYEDVPKIGVSPEVEEDIKFPAGITETTDVSAAPALTDADTKLPEIFDEIPETVTSQIDLTEIEKMSDSIEELQLVEKKSKDEVTDILADFKIRDELVEIPREDSLTEEPIESLKASENILPVSNIVEVESQDPSEKLSFAEPLFTPPEDLATPESATPEFATPESVTLEVAVPESATPELATPELATPELATSALADEKVATIDLKEVPIHIPELEDSTEMPKELAEQVEEMISVSEEDKLEVEVSAKPPEQPLELSPKQTDTKLPIVSEASIIPVENEELILDVAAEEEARIEETPSSFVTLRTPPPSKSEINPEIKESVSDPIHFEELETDAIPMTITLEDNKQPTTIDTEGQLEPAIPEIQENVKADSEIKPKVPEAQSHSDVREVELPSNKIAEDISSEGKMIVMPDRAHVGKPYLAIAKVESRNKLELPKPMSPCICMPRTCPLVDRSWGQKAKLKVLKVDTEGTQTTSPIRKSSQGKMDKPKLKTICESTCPFPEVGMWRRGTIWSRRPKDKSTIKTVCVDTQTDSTLGQERIPLEGMTPKDDCTCSGACPRKIKHGGYIKQISNRQPGEKRPSPVSLANAELYGSPKFPTSFTSSAEKEIAVVRYTGRSLVPQISDLECIECGRPITPEGSSLSMKSMLPTSSKSQKNITTSLKKMTGSRVTYKKDDLTCCECKTSGKMKTVSGYKKDNNKNSDKGSCDRDVCCPCPSDVTKKMSAKSSKKKRKLETKDQAIMANISRKTVNTFSKEIKDTDVNKKKSSNNTTSEIKFNDSKIKIVSEVLNADEVSYCVCDESSNETSIADGDSTGNRAINKMLKGNISCDCLLIDSVSKGSNCNCTENTN